jgi:hypothetical protein
MPQTVTAHLDGAQAWMRPSRRGDCSRSTAAWPVRFVAADRAAAARPALTVQPAIGIAGVAAVRLYRAGLCPARFAGPATARILPQSPANRVCIAFCVTGNDLHLPGTLGQVDNFAQLSLAATSVPGFVGFWRSYAPGDDVYAANVNHGGTVTTRSQVLCRRDDEAGDRRAATEAEVQPDAPERERGSTLLWRYQG